MSASVVIVNWNAGKRLRSCVESVIETAPDAEVVVVDNASSDGSMETLAGLPKDVEIIRNRTNRGLAAALNQAFRATAAPYVLTLNPDVHAAPGAIDLLQHFLDGQPRAGAIGGYVNENYLPRSLPTTLDLIREDLGFARKRTGPSACGPVEQPAAAAMMVRRNAYDGVGGFDERFFPAWYEDVDFCKRLRTAGWEIYFAPEARFQHDGGYSAAVLGNKAFAQAYYRNQFRYSQKHFGTLRSLAVRASIAAGMIGRMAVRPANAGAYAGVLRGALGGW